MAWARWRGSALSRARGLPWPTLQNGQRLVQISPMIIEVAVPPPKHSLRLGQEASSQTVASLLRRNISLILSTLGEALMRIRSQSGLRWTASLAITLTGIFSTLSAPRSFSPATARRVRFTGAMSVVLIPSTPREWLWVPPPCADCDNPTRPPGKPAYWLPAPARWAWHRAPPDPAPGSFPAPGNHRG